MALIGNHSVLNKSHARFTNGTSTAGAYVGNTRSNFFKPSIVRSRDVFLPNIDSIPSGYNAGQALRIARSSGQLASHVQIRCAGSLTSDASQGANIESTIDGVGAITNSDLALIIALTADLAGIGAISSADLASIQALAATLSGSGDITSADMDLLVAITAALSGSGEVTSEFTGLAHMTADISPFTELSPESLATQLLDSNDIESGYSMRESLRLILSALVGKLSGAETTTVSIRDINDTVDRIVATVDSNGNRTAVTKDVS